MALQPCGALHSSSRWAGGRQAYGPALSSRPAAAGQANPDNPTALQQLLTPASEGGLLSKKVVSTTTLSSLTWRFL